MTKKQKRSTNSVVASSTSAEDTSRSAAVRSRSSNASVEFNPDYSQTKKDLKRIGILAGTFVSFLVILSFFLR